jgi:hypothetical protein
MEDDKFNYRDMTRQFLENISQGEYEESARQDGLLVEAKKKAKSKKKKKKEPDYGDGAYFTGGPTADVKAREDAWSGGDNVFSDIDHVKVSGADSDPRSEDRIMSITELRSLIQREMGILSEVGTRMTMFSAPQDADVLDSLSSLRQRLSDEQIIYGLLSGEADLGAEAVDQLSKTVGMPDMLAFEQDPYDDPEDLPTESVPRTAAPPVRARPLGHPYDLPPGSEGEFEY